MTLPEMLDRIVKLAQAEVKCTYSSDSSVGNPTGEPWHPDSCRCKGTRKVPDPRFKGLALALTMPCSEDLHRDNPSDPAAKYYCACGGSGRVLRTEWLQQGELAGVLLHYLKQEMGRLQSAGKRWLPLAEPIGAISVTFGKPDCNERATELFLGFMEEATHATE